MATVLFEVRMTGHKSVRTTDPRGTFIACVHGEAASKARGYVNAIWSGAWINGEVWAPQADAVASALPHYLRAAYWRSEGWWWTGDDEDATGTMYLKDKRGRALATLKARGYVSAT